VTLSVKAGAEGRLFGSVKPADVAAAVEAAGLGAVDKRRVELVAPIKATGTHEAVVKLRDDIVATITLKVVAAK
jgi:large subunit ribosomal protein L9